MDALCAHCTHTVQRHAGKHSYTPSQNKQIIKERAHSHLVTVSGVRLQSFMRDEACPCAQTRGRTGDGQGHQQHWRHQPLTLLLLAGHRAKRHSQIPALAPVTASSATNRPDGQANSLLPLSRQGKVLRLGGFGNVQSTETESKAHGHRGHTNPNS